MFKDLGKFLETLMLSASKDDDSIDRLNYYFTPMLLIFFTLTVGAKSFVGEPLQCWVPHQFRKGWEKYAERYCFVENTYYLPLNDSFPDHGPERDQLELQYYQWVPFFLALQALLFYAPSVMWRHLKLSTGLSVSDLIQNTVTPNKKLAEEYGLNKTMQWVFADPKMMGVKFDAMRNFHDAKRSEEKGFFAKFSSSYITILYLLMKVIFLANLAFQLYAMNHFLGPQYTFWGFGILADLLNGRQWQSSGHFPRVTMCDIPVREMGEVQHNWTIQCVLMINMFNEKIFVFLWFWFVLVGFLTIINLIYWMVISFGSGHSMRLIQGYLRYTNHNESDRDVQKFIDDTLHKDGVTVLRLISDNYGDQDAAEIVEQLWKSYHQEEEEKKEKEKADRRAKNAAIATSALGRSEASTAPYATGEFDVPLLVNTATGYTAAPNLYSYSPMQATYSARRPNAPVMMTS